MEYIIFLFFLLTCASGFSAVTVSVLLYLKYRRESILYYVFFLSTLTVLTFSFVLDIFDSVSTLSNQNAERLIPVVEKWMQFMTYCIFILVGPFCFHKIMGQSIKPSKVGIFITLFVISLLDSINHLAFGKWFFGVGLVVPILFGVILYIIIFISLHLKNIGNSMLKNALKLFAIITSVFLPVIMLDSFPEHVALFPNSQPYATLTVPVYFFTINCLGTWFAIRYFNQPAFMDGGEITNYFIQKFDITNREKEITELLATGLSNKEIGKKLFISFRTVETHLFNIYKKTMVRNRVELANLIQTNKKS